MYPTLKLWEKMFTQPFYVWKFLLPNPFLFGTNPFIKNELSLNSHALWIVLGAVSFNKQGIAEVRLSYGDIEISVPSYFGDLP